MNGVVVCLITIFFAAFFAWRWYEAECRIQELEDEIEEYAINIRRIQRWRRQQDYKWGGQK